MTVQCWFYSLIENFRLQYTLLTLDIYYWHGIVHSTSSKQWVNCLFQLGQGQDIINLNLTKLWKDWEWPPQIKAYGLAVAWVISMKTLWIVGAQKLTLEGFISYDQKHVGNHWPARVTLSWVEESINKWEAWQGRSGVGRGRGTFNYPNILILPGPGQWPELDIRADCCLCVPWSIHTIPDTSIMLANTIIADQITDPCCMQSWW